MKPVKIVFKMIYERINKFHIILILYFLKIKIINYTKLKFIIFKTNLEIYTYI